MHQFLAIKLLDLPGLAGKVASYNNHGKAKAIKVRVYLIIPIILCGLFLLACGKKGGLYLPPQNYIPSHSNEQTEAYTGEHNIGKIDVANPYITQPHSTVSPYNR